jgi:hypothetical protein
VAVYGAGEAGLPRGAPSVTPVVWEAFGKDVG